MNSAESNGLSLSLAAVSGALTQSLTNLPHVLKIEASVRVEEYGLAQTPFAVEQQDTQSFTPALQLRDRQDLFEFRPTSPKFQKYKANPEL